MAILEAEKLREGDVIVLDPFSSVAWVEGDLTLKEPLVEPHMGEPTTPSLMENPVLLEAVRAVRLFCSKIMANVVVIVMAPNPQFMMAPCCQDHMPNWTELATPQILIEGLIKVDREIEEALCNLRIKEQLPLMAL